MVYECEECGDSLPAGVLACPKCGQTFNEAVPKDAEVPKRGWQSRADVASATIPSGQQMPSAPPPTPSIVPPSVLPTSHDPDREYWLNKVGQAQAVALTATKSPFFKQLKQKWLLTGTASLIFVTSFIALILPHTNSYVFQQHPTYQSTMVSFMNAPRAEQIEYSWPYQDHENRLHVAFHTPTYSTSGTPTKADLDKFATIQRYLFCALRHNSGFTPDEAMSCQVYVSTGNSSDEGYNGPEVSPSQDALVKDHLDEIK